MIIETRIKGTMTIKFEDARIEREDGSMAEIASLELTLIGVKEMKIDGVYYIIYHSKGAIEWMNQGSGDVITKLEI